MLAGVPWDNRPSPPPPGVPPHRARQPLRKRHRPTPRPAARTCATSPSSPTSITARPRSWTRCCARPARSAPTRPSWTGSWIRATSSARRASRSSPSRRRSITPTSASTSSIRPGTPTSAARSSARCSWSIRCCCSWTRPRVRCPQTRYVLQKAMARRLPVIVAHQQDRPVATRARPRSSTRSTSCSWTSAPTRTRSTSRSSTRTPRPARPRPPSTTPGEDLHPLFDVLIEVTPAPTYTPDHPLQLLVTNLSANDYVGRMAVGRIWNGRIRRRPAHHDRARGGGRHGRDRGAGPDGHAQRGRDEPPDRARDRPHRHHRGRTGRHRQRRGPARGDDRRHADRSRRPAPAAAARR